MNIPIDNVEDFAKCYNRKASDDIAYWQNAYENYNKCVEDHVILLYGTKEMKDKYIPLYSNNITPHVEKKRRIIN